MRILVFLLAFASCAMGQSFDELFARGVSLDERHANAEALEVFLTAEKLSPSDSETLRYIAKQYSQMIVDAPSKGRKRELAANSLEYALRAKDANPKNPNARLALAICYGKVAFMAPARKKVEYSRLIKEEAEAAISLDPTNDYAWHVLGRWNYELANFNAALRFLAEVIYGKFPDASTAEAARCLEKAIALGPKRVIHHTELGRTYLALGRKAEARAQLETALKLPSREKDDDESKERAREALKALQ